MEKEMKKVKKILKNKKGRKKLFYWLETQFVEQIGK